MVEGARSFPIVNPSGNLKFRDVVSDACLHGFKEAISALRDEVQTKVAIDIDPGDLSAYKHNLSTEKTICVDVKTLVDYQINKWGSEAKFAYPPEIINKELQGLIGKVDLLIAGPPCEGHSSLNNRTRGEDPRNLLYLDVIALAIALRAKAMIIENVPDIVRDKRQIVETAKSLIEKEGYSTDSGILAMDELGLAQTRRRLFLAGSKMGLVPFSEIVNVFGGREASDIAWAIEDLIDRQDDAMDVPSTLSSENERRIAWLFENDAYDLPNHMRPLCHKEGHTYPAVYGRMRWDAPAGTISCGFLSPGRGRYTHPLRQRTITPREAARLQGFPDWYTFLSGNGKATTRTYLAKWIGDAVPPILGYTAAFTVIPGFLPNNNILLEGVYIDGSGT